MRKRKQMLLTCVCFPWVSNKSSSLSENEKRESWPVRGCRVFLCRAATTELSHWFTFWFIVNKCKKLDLPLRSERQREGKHNSVVSVRTKYEAWVKNGSIRGVEAVAFWRKLSEALSWPLPSDVSLCSHDSARTDVAGAHNKRRLHSACLPNCLVYHRPAVFKHAEQIRFLSELKRRLSWAPRLSWMCRGRLMKP